MQPPTRAAEGAPAPRSAHLALVRRFAGVLPLLAPLAGRAAAALRAGAPPEPAPADVARLLRKKRPGLPEALCGLIAGEALSGLGRLLAALEAGVADHAASLRAPQEYARFAFLSFQDFEEQWGAIIGETWGAGAAAVCVEAGRVDPAARAAGALAVLIADGRGEDELARARALLVRQLEEGGGVPFGRNALSKCLVAFKLWELALHERGLALLCAGRPFAPPPPPAGAGADGGAEDADADVEVDVDGEADGSGAGPAAGLPPAAWLRRARRVDPAAGRLRGGAGAGAPGWGLLVGYLAARAGAPPLGPCRRLAAAADPVEALRAFCMGAGAQDRDSGGRGPRPDPLTDLKQFRWLLAERLEAAGRAADARAVLGCDLLAAFAEGRALAGSCGPAPAAPPPGRG